MDRNTFFDNLKNYNANSLHNNIINKHASNRFEFYDSLQHHGIIGQKWGVRRYQNPDGTLTEEGKQRYLNPDGTLNAEGQKKLGKDGVAKFNQTKNVQSWQNGYDEEQQKAKLDNARQNKKWDKAFIETIQNAEDMNDNEMYREYEKYLKNPTKYVNEFNSNNWKDNNSTSKDNSNTSTNDDWKDEMYNEISKVQTGKDGKPDFDAIQKVLDKYNDQSKKAYEQQEKDRYDYNARNKQKSDDDIEKEQLELYKKKMNETLDKKGHITPSDMEKWNKEIESETGHKIKTGQEKAKEAKAAKKAEKQELKAARKEVEKNLKGGILGNWALLNKAMKEAGITDQKNMTAADWNKVNEEIKKLRR